MQRRKFIEVSVSSTIPILTMGSIPLQKDKKGFIVNANKDRFNQPTKYRGVNPNYVKVSAKDTGRNLTFFEYVGYEKIGPPMHIHFDQDEIFYIVEGEFLFQLGEERFTLKAGDTAFLPRKIQHTWLQLSDKGKLVYMLQPAGKMEEFFKKMNELKGPPTEDQIQKIHLEHEMKVVGPPISI